MDRNKNTCRICDMLQMAPASQNVMPYAQKLASLMETGNLIFMTVYTNTLYGHKCIQTIDVFRHKPNKWNSLEELDKYIDFVCYKAGWKVLPNWRNLLPHYTSRCGWVEVAAGHYVYFAFYHEGRTRCHCQVESKASHTPHMEMPDPENPRKHYCIKCFLQKYNLIAGGL